jgi:glycosyltransferase involved in cell wall biosynthesis
MHERKSPAVPVYVVITAARNEAVHIGKTLSSMAAQTVRPIKWFVVSDGSTDRTNELVGEFMAHHGWVELICLPPREGRHWGAKVDAFNVGYARASQVPFEFVANLDADVSLSADYFERLLDRFATSPKLGVLGGEVFNDIGNGRVALPVCHDRHEIPGPCQFFRRPCFEEIGGYLRMLEGGEDAVVTMNAKMLGWGVERLSTCHLIHHRPVGGLGSRSVWAVGMLYGKKDYLLGDHPLWELGRLFYRMRDKPYVLNSVVRFASYCWSCLRRIDRQVPDEFVAFRRRWQMRRLRRAVCMKDEG